MWEEILKLAVSNGIWAVLFLGLLIYQLRDSAGREKKYQITIEKLNQHLDVVNELQNDINDIKNDIKEVVLLRKDKYESKKQNEKL